MTAWESSAGYAVPTAKDSGTALSRSSRPGSQRSAASLHCQRQAGSCGAGGWEQDLRLRILEQPWKSGKQETETCFFRGGRSGKMENARRPRRTMETQTGRVKGKPASPSAGREDAGDQGSQRRPWNTGATGGSEDMPRKLLDFRSVRDGSGAGRRRRALCKAVSPKRDPGGIEGTLAQAPTMSLCRLQEEELFVGGTQDVER